MQETGRGSKAVRSAARRESGGDGACHVEVDDPGGALAAAELAWVREQAPRAAAFLGAAGEVRVRVVGDAEMSAAHKRYSGIAGTTDVLTFDMREVDLPHRPGADGGSVARLDTDILACADEARRAAAARGHPVERELLLYIVHGMLHCLGHDDHDEAAAAAMHAREDEVLRAIGVGAVFAKPGGA